MEIIIDNKEVTIEIKNETAKDNKIVSSVKTLLTKSNIKYKPRYFSRFNHQYLFNFIISLEDYSHHNLKEKLEKIQPVVIKEIIRENNNLKIPMCFGDSILEDTPEWQYCNSKMFSRALAKQLQEEK